MTQPRQVSTAGAFALLLLLLPRLPAPGAPGWARAGARAGPRRELQAALSAGRGSPLAPPTAAATPSLHIS